MSLSLIQTSLYFISLCLKVLGFLGAFLKSRARV
jgi:hypothetical protein